MFDSSWFQPFDYSSVVADSSMLSAMFSSLKFSLRSAGSIGLIILGVTLSISLISTILNRLFLDKQKIIKATEKREFSRKVFSADFDRNLDSMVADGVKHRELNFLVGQKYRELHSDWDIENSVHRREISKESAKQYYRGRRSK